MQDYWNCGGRYIQMFRVAKQRNGKVWGAEEWGGVGGGVVVVAILMHTISATV